MTARATIRASLAANPVQTLKDLGGQAGVSPERVRQIISADHLHRETPLRVAGPSYSECISCGKKRWGSFQSNQCRICNPKPAERITLTCEGCGEKFERPQSRRNNHDFCSRSCFSRWVGKNFGGWRTKRKQLAALAEAAGPVQKWVNAQARCPICKKSGANHSQNCPVPNLGKNLEEAKHHA